MKQESQGLNFTEKMRLICADMTQKIAALQHIQMERVAVGFCQTRSSSKYGHYASLTPLRFENGALTTHRNGREYTLQRILDPNGKEYLYLLNFYVPRFLNSDFREKLITIVHELLHISEKFDGDIRRFEGRCYAHSGSQKNYDAYAERLASLWLAKDPPLELYEFLRFHFDELRTRYGDIYGRKYSIPKLIRISENH
ncbi:MAG: hypothetical protein E7028_08870 [Planctomycetaceae bacterium]|nr:hypothetical protein [Planctomycetaceae bacterium]MBQ2820623.1 hypothetical protein [Thermoguttaceae bacterium]